MLSTLSFVFISCLFANLLVEKGAAMLAWAKSTASDIEKKL